MQPHARAVSSRGQGVHNGRAGLRVRVEIMGSQKCGIVGKSQPVLMMVNPIIFTRTRNRGGRGGGHRAARGAVAAAAGAPGARGWVSAGGPAPPRPHPCRDD
eukprot:COSAG01_NODE_58_length_30193_cov_12.302020_8_plen_102_part_00